MFDPTLIIASAATVPVWVTVAFCLLLAGLIGCLALEEVLHAKKSIIAGAFAVICLVFGTATGIFSFEEVVVGSHEATVSENVEAEFVGDDDQVHVVPLAPAPPDENHTDSSHSDDASETDDHAPANQ